MRIDLKPRQERRILEGHAWVFSNEIARVTGPVEPGGVAEAFAASGRTLGVGFYNPSSLIAWRRLSPVPREIDAGFFRERLEAALAYRDRLWPGERFYRLCFGESDGLPGLVIDRYDAVFVLQILSAGMDRKLAEIEAALSALFSPRGIYLKNDHRARALEGLKSECRVHAGEVPERVEISESGLRYSARIKEGQKTGFYFDQRENRLFLRPFFQGRVVADLHCFNGAFSLNAAKFGAKSVLGIDSSEEAVELARESAALNGLENVRFEAGDAEEALRAFASAPPQERPGMILLDPPSFVHSKKQLPQALKAYVKLNSLAFSALSPGGLLATSTCSHHVSREIFAEMLRLSAAKAGKPARLLALRGQAADHPILLAMPETEYLHFALIEAL